MHRILTALALLAPVFSGSPAASSAAAQQPTLELARDPGLRDAVADARRLELITDVRQPEPGTLQLTIGPAFGTSASRAYNLGRLYLVYAAYQRGHEGPIVVELLHGGEKVGEYTKDGLHLTGQLPSPPAPAAAPPPPTPARRGGHWYAALGVGGGAADFTCERCVFERSSAPSGYVMLGRRLGDRTVLGVEATGWQKNDDLTRGWLYTATAVALARFDDGLPLFLSAGIGYAGFRRRVPAGTAGADAVGYSARVGAELRIARRLYLAPYLGIVGSFGEPEFTYAHGLPYGLAANFTNIQFGAAVVLQ